VPVNDILAEIYDVRKGGNLCSFNGYLEDYLTLISEEGEIKALLEQFHEIDGNLKICVNLGFDVNKEVISNQIIRYKDASKLPKHYMRCPYVVYGNTSMESPFGLLLYDGSKSNHLIAKGIYYSLTEQSALFENARNELVAMTTDSLDMCVSTLKRMIEGSVRIGAIQREIDRSIFTSFEDSNEKALAKANEIKENAVNLIPQHPNRGELIYEAITKWYLLKKAIYVQYMTNKDILVQVNENNIKKQRHNAKVFADQIPFMAFSEMWRL